MLQRPTSVLLSALLLSLPLPGLAQDEVEDETGLDADELIVEERAYVEEDGTVVIEETISYVEDDEDSEPVAPGAAPQAAPNRSPGGSGISQAEARGILQRHNTARAEVGVPPLAWSGEIASYAQQWADELAATQGCELEHRPSSRYGENLAAGFEPYDPVQLWYSEKPLYEGGPVDESTMPAGHYTQVVWRHTARIGCGKARCGGDSVVVCNYDPAGNTLGERPY